jgi:hypothetical protein
MKRGTGLARVWSRGWGRAAVVAVVLAAGAGGATAVPSAAVAGSPPVLNWTSHSVAPHPGNQTFEAMAYDAATGTVVLFAFSGATWTWNGTAWTQLHLRVHPPAGSGQVMAYDAATGTVVLFGGCCNRSGRLFGDTWTWDGTTWTRQHPATSPPLRENAVMAYDAATGTVVLFGGYDGSPLDGTWTWDGTTWARQFPATVPPARYASQMAYDAATGTVVMFGGQGTTTMLDDTWTWG